LKSSYKGYSIVKSPPWPGAKENFTYILQEKQELFQIALSSLPQSNSYQIYNSYFNTHVPALEMLGVENTLVGFPNTDYISSEKHENIDAGKIREENETLNQKC
jgi:iron complex transport system substrate-binding protein